MPFLDRPGLLVRLMGRGAPMRRMLAVAFLSATLTVLPSALAQRAGHAGGHGGGVAGGSMGHMGGGFAGGSVGRSPGFAPRGFTGPNFVSTAPTHAVSTAPSRAFAPGYRRPYVGPAPAWHRDGRGDHDRDRYRSPYRGYGYGGYPYVYANSWELLPWDLGSSDLMDYSDNSGSDVQQQPAASAAPPDEGYRPEYEVPAEEPAPWPQPAGNQFASSPVAPEPALTLIFNDGHQETIHNYVLTAEAVIVLDQAASGRQKRIPLASLNLAATVQAAQQAGLDFTPPA